MKNKNILLVILGVCFLAELTGANQLAIIKLTPEQRIEAAQINLLVYQDFKDAILVGLNN